MHDPPSGTVRVASVDDRHGRLMTWTLGLWRPGYWEGVGIIQRDMATGQSRKGLGLEPSILAQRPELTF